MPYQPSKVTKKDPFSDEVIVDGKSVQRNLDLIAKETNILADSINANHAAAEKLDATFKRRTSFVNSFLFG